MLGRIVSLRRLRFYEDACRRASATAQTEIMRRELEKYCDTFHNAAENLLDAAKGAVSPPQD